MASLSVRSLALGYLGYPSAAVADAERAIKEAREIGQAASLMYALIHASVALITCGNYSTAGEVLDELIAVAKQKAAPYWKAGGMVMQGRLLVETGNAEEAVRMITSGLGENRSPGMSSWLPNWLSYLSKAYLELGQFDKAWGCVAEAISALEATKQRVTEADVYRTAGEIALASPEPDEEKAEAYFEHALVVARGQQAKSPELRAAMGDRPPLSGPGGMLV